MSYFKLNVKPLYLSLVSLSPSREFMCVCEHLSAGDNLFNILFLTFLDLSEEEKEDVQFKKVYVPLTSYLIDYIIAQCHFPFL
jgi:hypothetical protein